MNNKTVTTPIVDYHEMTSQDMLVNRLMRMPAIAVAQLRYVDVWRPSLNCHGIYAFFGGDEYHVYDNDSGQRIDCWYIGSAAGAAMVGRLGSHFAPRHKDFGNSLLKRIAYTVASPADKLLFSEKDPSLQQKQRMEEIIRDCFPIMQSLQLRILLYEETEDEKARDEIHSDEKTLISHYKPAFNNPKRTKRDLEIRDINGNKIIQL